MNFRERIIARRRARLFADRIEADSLDDYSKDTIRRAYEDDVKRRSSKGLFTDDEFKSICKNLAKKLNVIPKTATITSSGFTCISKIGFNAIGNRIEDLLFGGDLGFTFGVYNRAKVFPVKLPNYASRVRVGVYDCSSGFNDYGIIANLYVTTYELLDGTVLVSVAQGNSY